MNLLALDTSTDACSVALAVGAETLVDHRVEPRRHAQLVLPMIDALLAEAGLTRGALDGVAFGRGPGSFTGVRVAASVTQGIALGLDVGVVGVSSLATIAEGCRRELGDARVGVALDARLDEIYWGAFVERGGVMCSCVRERVCAAEAATFADASGAVDASDANGGAAAVPGETPAAAASDIDARDWRLAGPGAERYADVLRETLGLGEAGALRHDRLPQARDTLALARSAIAADGLEDAASAVPVYLRERVAATEAERHRHRS